MSWRVRLVTVAAAAGLFLAVTVATGNADVAGDGDLRVTFKGALAPKELPRNGSRPVRIGLGGSITTGGRAELPPLRRLVLTLNRQGRIMDRGLPVCRRPMIADTIFRGALANCLRAMVGHGRARATVYLPGQRPFSLLSRALIFNAPREKGQRRLWLYMTANQPFSPTILKVAVRESRGGGRQMVIPFSGDVPFRLSEFRLLIGSRLGKPAGASGYLHAGCPAPPAFPGATFMLANATFVFEGREPISAGQIATCRVKPPRSAR